MVVVQGLLKYDSIKTSSKLVLGRSSVDISRGSGSLFCTKVDDS